MKEISLIILLLALGYLLFGYIRFDNTIGMEDLKAPSLREYTIPNNSGIALTKYVALGDSLTAGVGNSDYQKTFVYQIAKKLSVNSTVDVINLGVPGATVDDLIDVQLPQVIKINPDYISLLIGINDIHDKSSASAFGKKIRLVLDELQSKTKAKIIVFTIPYLAVPKSVLPPLGWILDYQTKQFNKQIAVNSQSARIQIIDLYSTKLDFSQKPEYYSSDLFHPSDQGYQRWSQIVIDAD